MRDGASPAYSAVPKSRELSAPHLVKKKYKAGKEGRWEYHCKYIEENRYCYLYSMKFTDRCIIAVVSLSDCQEVMAATIHLLVHWMRRK